MDELVNYMPQLFRFKMNDGTWTLYERVSYGRAANIFVQTFYFTNVEVSLLNHLTECYTESAMILHHF